MNRKIALSLAALLLPGTAAILLPRPATAQVLPAPALMNFQGRLARPDGTPVADGDYSIRFSLWDAASGGTEKWNQTIVSAAVTNGVFDVLLDVGAAGLFNGNLWLEIKIGTDAALAPRQRLVSSAYALKANTVPDGSIGLNQLAGGVLNFSNLGGSLVGSQITNGTITADKLAFSVGGSGWTLIGNSGTDPATHFLGTTDNQPLILKVNNRQAMRYQYVEDIPDPNPIFQSRSVNVLGGTDINSIGAGVIAATIAGGGQDYFDGIDYPNQVNANFGTVGGGIGNNVSGIGATIAGGVGHYAEGKFVAIGGGASQIVRADYATVPGGFLNYAFGKYSFAAGQQARAGHDGAFVWNDASDLTIQNHFASTGINQFLVRATGGVGINKNNPAPGTLDVNGSVFMTGFKLPTGAAANSVLTSDASGVGTWQSVAGLLGNAGGDLTGTYPNPTIANNAVSTAKIASNAVTTVKIADSAVSTAKIADASVTSVKIANDAVTTLKVADGNITAAKLAPGIIPTSLPPSGAAGGDLTGNYPNPAITTNAVGSSKLASEAASLNKVSGGTLTSTGSSIGIGTTTPAGLFDVYGFRAAGAEAPDQQQAALTDVAVGLDQWQSFTPAASGYLSRIDLKVNSPVADSGRGAPGTLYIYAGEGTSGALLAIQNVTYQNVTPQSFQTFPLMMPVAVTAGQKYTVRFTTPVQTFYWLYYHANNPYAGGRASIGTNADYVFKTYVTAGTYGALLTVSNGNVGLGTTTPGQRLSVVGTVESTSGGFKFPDGTVQTTAFGGAAGGDLTGTYPNPTIANNVVTTAKLADSAVTSGKLASDAASLSKVSGGAMINSAGNIGLGIATPTAKLHLYGGNVRVDDGEFQSWGQMVFHPDVDISGDDIVRFVDSGGNENMRVHSNGYVGIGVTTPAYRLELPNTANNDGRARANSWVTYSSGRWKHNVTAIENPLEKLLRMRGVMFDWNEENGGGHDIGFVAEEAGAVVPELVTWEKDGKFAQGMKYDRVSALLVEAVKTLKKENDAKDARIQSLEARLARLEAALSGGKR